ncbi:7TM diverse intracellular signaling domain-containing protein [Oligoflexus tunisiensis]|uniref:7TM diverse intracellular signaling domain-containing protein n=1 Tax=Oligoflexus tunisiensis TaxID=708132 RepID=UPI00159F1404|nr:7TM diverse intracellular signaling domain-containing protein [Oligoflexus tunisiensis]
MLPLLAFAIGFIFCCLQAQAEESRNTVTAVQGTLHLEPRDFENQNLIALDGEWEFHWESLHSPEDFATGRVSEPAYFRVPELWNDHSIGGKALSGSGYATYRLKITLPVSYPQALALHIPEMGTAYRLFINGSEAASTGQVGRDAASSRPGRRQSIAKIPFGVHEVELIFQVSNFHHMTGGTWNSIVLGSEADLLRRQKLAIGTDAFIIGGLLFMALYHLMIFLFRRGNRSPLLFAVFCFAVAARSIQSGEGQLGFILWPNFSWELSYKLHYLGWLIATPALSYFWALLYPKESIRIYIIANFLFGLCTSLIVLFTEARIFSQTYPIFTWLTFVLLAFGLHVTILSAVRKREGALVNLIGVTILIAAGMHDALYSLGLFSTTTSLMHIGLYGYAFSQATIIAKRFSGAFRRAETAEAAVRKLNAGLEEVVEEKTLHIKSIMENIKLGIFTILPEGKRIHPDYSQHLKEVFEVDSPMQSNAVDILFRYSDLSSDAKNQAEAALDACLGEAQFTFSLNRHCLPSIMRVNLPSQRQKTIEMDWNPICDQEVVKEVLVTARDVTELRKLELEAEKHRKDMEIIGEILEIPHDSFARFIDLGERFIEENRGLIRKIDAQNHIEVIRILFINMHTLKGAARSYGFRNMSHILHDAEAYYALLQKTGAAPDPMKLNDDLNRVEAILETYNAISTQKIGRKPLAVTKLEIDRAKARDAMLRLDTLIQQNLTDEARHAVADIERTFHEMFYKPAALVLDDLLKPVASLARMLKKARPHISVEDPGFGLNQEGHELLGNIFIHLVRNSMDHGIETPEERKKKGKDPQGTLRIQLVPDGDSLLIAYSDDGAGLDLKKLKDIGIERGLLTDDVSLTPQRISALIFDAGISTSSSITDISGRGVGMNAVQKYIEKGGGSIAIILRESAAPGSGHRPFEFHIRLPRPLWAPPLRSEKPRQAAAS